MPISDKGTDLSSAHQRQDKPDEYCCSYQLKHIYVGFSAQGVKYTLCPVGEVELRESEAVAWPEESLRGMPHLVLDEMHAGAKGEDEKPGFAPVLVEVKAGKGDEDEKEEGMVEYPAVAKGISKKELPYGFIDDVGEKRA